MRSNTHRQIESPSLSDAARVCQGRGFSFCEPVKVAGEPFGGATDGLCSQQEKVTGHEFPVFHREKGKEDKEKEKEKKNTS